MLGKGASGTAVMEHVRGQNGRRESGRQGYEAENRERATTEPIRRGVCLGKGASRGSVVLLLLIE